MKNRLLKLFVFCAMISAFPLAAAQKYTVKKDGTGNFTTIQSCANAMGNGDTCLVYAGTYNEHVNLPAGGIGAYKTLMVNGTDSAYVLDFVLHSHNKLIGFHIQNPSSPSSNDCVGMVDAATDIFITNNVFYACGYHAMISGVNAADKSSYVYIQDNTFSYSHSTSAAPNVGMGLELNGDYHLVENNDISHTSDGIGYSGTHNIFRSNTFHDNTTSDCGTNSSNCHIDFLESEPAVSTQNNIIEGNTELNNLGHDGHGYLSQGDFCNGQCHHLIIRFNTGAHVGSGGILDNLGGFSYVKAYNNTWVDFNNYPGNELYGATNGFTSNSVHGSTINDLFYYPQALADFNPYITDTGTVRTFSVGHNLAYCTGLPCKLHGHVYGNGLFTDDPGNKVADPKFVNYAGNDFRLTAGSPAIGAGTYLTTVAAGDAGSGTSLMVNDADFFQDGYGLQGVQADWIRVGPAITVQILSVNYSTNSLTLVSPISRSPGDPVYLFKDSEGKQVFFGSAPDIGANPYDAGIGLEAGRLAKRISTVSVFPNPARSAFTIALRKAKGLEFSVYAPDGRKIYFTTLAADAVDYKIAADKWTAGVYIWRISGDSHPERSGKFFILR